MDRLKPYLVQNSSTASMRHFQNFATEQGRPSDCWLDVGAEVNKRLLRKTLIWQLPMRLKNIWIKEGYDEVIKVRPPRLLVVEQQIRDKVTDFTWQLGCQTSQADMGEWCACDQEKKTQRRNENTDKQADIWISLWCRDCYNIAVFIFFFPIQRLCIRRKRPYLKKTSIIISGN